MSSTRLLDESTILRVLRRADDPLANCSSGDEELLYALPAPVRPFTYRSRFRVGRLSPPLSPVAGCDESLIMASSSMITRRRELPFAFVPLLCCVLNHYSYCRRRSRSAFEGRPRGRRCWFASAMLLSPKSILYPAPLVALWSVPNSRLPCTSKVLTCLFRRDMRSARRRLLWSFWSCRRPRRFWSCMFSLLTEKRYLRWLALNSISSSLLSPALSEKKSLQRLTEDCYDCARPSCSSIISSSLSYSFPLTSGKFRSIWMSERR